MMTSAQIRQSFLDFFREKKHTIVPSSSLMPDSPNLLFTNAGMNQFVPIFLGERKADVDKWAGAVVERDAVPTRAADTQKCIRAGGKHNDLDDVGLDTYHHTFFEMLGNWSFGDYFKKEAIEWAWELVVERWKFPAQRLYATIYQPDPGDPAERDVEAWGFWAEKFRAAGLDPAIHIVNGNKKDNFWMMGETGPCGPCSELHVDLTPPGDTRGALVNKGTAECIEIWNLVFIQFNANADGTFSPLPAKHVDTGMGFERVTSIIQGTKQFTDLANAKISNYETDIFRPIFDELEKMSSHKYGGTLPTSAAPERPGSALVPSAGEGVPPSRTSSDVASDSSARSSTHVAESSSPRDAATSTRDARTPRNTVADQIAIDVAFRVIADHIRTLSFAIADGIQPGNTDRNYVLRRILRRAVRYGRTLGFHEPFFYKLVAVLARTMGDTFPEIRAKQKHVEEVLRREEEAFNKTLDRGIEKFNAALHTAVTEHNFKAISASGKVVWIDCGQFHFESTPASKATVDRHPDVKIDLAVPFAEQLRAAGFQVPVFRGVDAFELYDTYGFPLDLTELMARERGLTVDTAGFEVEMEKQRARARAAQKKQVIELSEIETKEPTKFSGYDSLETPATVLEVVTLKDKTAVVLDATACYAEMGGQVGDTGEIAGGGQLWNILNTQKSGATFLHFIESVMGEDAPAVGANVTLSVDAARRGAIQRHHTVTHLLHWALHQVVSREASQKGSYVGPEKLTFDFNHQALTPQQVRDVERLVNERIVENAPVSWIEMPYADVRGRGDIMQFFGDKYGETVRVVQIGGAARALDGYSMELCAGTHTRATGEIGLFRINAESAIAAGVRRIEAQAGLNAYDLATADTQRLHGLATRLGTPLPELEKRIEGMVAQQKELEKALKAASQREAAGRAKDLLASAETINGMPAIITRIDGADGDTLQNIADALKSLGFKGVTVLGGSANGTVALVASVSSDFTARVQAGKII
ncbi:MAG TPA: alanine--tRNA ligase, partial [Chthoniobacteraceae bacterium]|nr:alanine--tRNA ligase [Chthoniobacteraceae bacterium]